MDIAYLTVGKEAVLEQSNKNQHGAAALYCRLARRAKTKEEYEKDFETLFGENVQIKFEDFLEYDDEEQPLSEFDKNMKKALKYKS